MPQEPVMTDLEKLKALAQEAKSLPWDVSAAMTADEEFMVVGGTGQVFGLIAVVPDGATALFMVDAVNAIPDLIARLEASEAERVRLSGALLSAREELASGLSTGASVSAIAIIDAALSSPSERRAAPRARSPQELQDRMPR